MVTYNHERYIAQGVESALAQQTTFPFEVVVGEDCSTDGTRRILQDLARRHPGKLRLLLPERNVGMMRNFAQVLAQCRGRFVALLDGDDHWTNPRKLQRQVDALESHPEWAMCFHPAQCVFEDGLQGTAVYPETLRREEATLVDLLEENFMATSSVVFRNRLFSELPSWFLDLKLGDWPLHILNAAHGKIGFFPDAMSVYRIHAGGVWSGQKQAQRLTSVFEMLSAIDRHFAGKYAKTIDQSRLRTLHWLAGEAGRLAGEARQLAEENRDLREFRDTWRRSYSYRIAKEVRRVWNQSRRLWDRPDRRPAAVPSISKAA